MKVIEHFKLTDFQKPKTQRIKYQIQWNTAISYHSEYLLNVEDTLKNITL